MSPGRVIEDPWRRPFRSEKLYVSRESWMFAMVQAPGLRLLYDFHGRVYVRLDPSYRGRVRRPSSGAMGVFVCLSVSALAVEER